MEDAFEAHVMYVFVFRHPTCYLELDRSCFHVSGTWNLKKMQVLTVRERALASFKCRRQDSKTGRRRQVDTRRRSGTEVPTA